MFLTRWGIRESRSATWTTACVDNTFALKLQSIIYDYWREVQFFVVFFLTLGQFQLLFSLCRFFFYLNSLSTLIRVIFFTIHLRWNMRWLQLLFYISFRLFIAVLVFQYDMSNYNYLSNWILVRNEVTLTSFQVTFN